MNELILIYLFSVIIIGIIISVLFIFFYYKFTNDIIVLLKEQGFIDLSNKMSQLISTGGKMPFMGSLEAKPLSKAWNEFIRLKIPKASKKLYKLHFFYKSLILAIIIIFILFFILLSFFILFIFLPFIR